MEVRAKKNLGQHFLIDQDIASRIVGLYTGHFNPELLIEIGPGTGVLTQHLLKPASWRFLAADVDKESIDFLKKTWPDHADQFVLQDFLQLNSSTLEADRLAVIGNFPYNISSQLFFKMLEMPLQVTEIVCMLQREVARRIASGPGSKEYGILSVLLQSRYKVEYAFTVDEHVFQPPPKVKSGVIRLSLLENKVLPFQFKNLQKLVKQAFNTRRKTLRNALKPIGIPESIQTHFWLDKRAEQLEVSEFEELTRIYEENGLLKT